MTWDLSSAGRASALQAEGHRFKSCRSHLFFVNIKYGGIAQLVEQRTENPCVAGSIPALGIMGH